MLFVMPGKYGYEIVDDWQPWFDQLEWGIFAREYRRLVELYAREIVVHFDVPVPDDSNGS